MKIILFLIAFSSSVFAEANFVIKETKEDLNKSGKKDAFVWMGESKESVKPTRFVIKMDDKSILDVLGNFCPPEELGAGPSGCIHLQTTKKLSTRNEHLIEFKRKNGQTNSTYIYRLNGGSFTIISASKKGPGESSDINYLTGRAMVSSKKTTITQICTLKNPRKNQKISEFDLFDISEETVCE